MSTAARHTPGPWTVGDEVNPLVYSASGGAYVAQVLAYSDGATGASRPEATADALLIAAAPELLEALREMLAVYGNDGHFHAPALRATRASQAAIAKATGAAP